MQRTISRVMGSTEPASASGAVPIGPIAPTREKTISLTTPHLLICCNERQFFNGLTNSRRNKKLSTASTQARLLQQRNCLFTKTGHALEPARPGEKNSVKAGLLQNR